MRILLIKLTLFVILLVTVESIAQNAAIDSLKTMLAKEKTDTTRVNFLNDISRELMNTGEYELAIEYASKALAFAEKSNFKKGMAYSYNNIGIIHADKGDYDKALGFYLKSLKIREEIGDKKGMAGSYNNIGNINKYKGDYDNALKFYFKAVEINEEMGNKNWLAINYNNSGNIHSGKGDYDKALEFFLKSLKIREEIELAHPDDIGNKNGMAMSWNNIGIIHYDKGDYNKALEFFLKSLKIREEIGVAHPDDIGNKNGMAMSWNDIGAIHQNKGDYDKALEFYLKALKIMEETGEKIGIANSFNNIGAIHSDKNDYVKALDYFLKAMKIKEELGDKHGMALNYNNIGSLCLMQNKKLEAREWQIKALATAMEIGARPQIIDAYSGLAQADSALGNYRSAYEHYKLYIAYKDSVHNAESEKKMLQTEMQHEYDKKETIARVEQEKKDALALEELEKQTMQRNGFIGGFALMFALAGVSYRSFRNKSKANKIISLQKQEVERQKVITESQKHLVEEKNKEILDSITYAKRLQEAILPPTKLIKEYLDDSFILFKPKDIVAGDFYWMEVIDNVIFIAAADCTGHGVPGAIVSVVCSNALNRSVKEFGLRDTGKILDKTTRLVVETFEKSGEQIKDGMDISILSFNKTNYQIQWSGANNPLWYIQNEEIKKIKADKQPIGKFDGHKPFATHEIEYCENSTFYLFTDGFPDQFGGSKGKKYMYKKFEEKLSSIYKLKMNVQQLLLEKEFQNWKGNIDQVDDVTVIGIKI